MHAGLAWKIGLVDRYNSFSIIALPSFKQQNKTTIYPSEHARKPFKTTLPVPVYDPTNELFYFVGNEIIYRGKLGDEYMEPIYILTGYTESEEASSNTGRYTLKTKMSNHHLKGSRSDYIFRTVRLTGYLVA